MNPGLFFRKAATLLAFLSLGIAGNASAYSYQRTGGDEPLPAMADSSFSDVLTGSLTFQTSLPPGHVVLPPVSFTGVSLFESTDHQVDAVGQKRSAFNYSGSSLAAGLYSFHVPGNTSPRSGGNYVVSLQALPAPELSEWVMMLAGFGLVSLIAWRRKQPA